MFSASEECNFTFTNTSSYVLSPDFPYNSSAGMTCNYFIIQPEGYRIDLTWEYFFIDGNCSQGYVRVCQTFASTDYCLLQTSESGK